MIVRVSERDGVCDVSGECDLFEFRESQKENNQAVISERMEFARSSVLRQILTFVLFILCNKSA